MHQGLCKHIYEKSIKMLDSPTFITIATLMAAGGIFSYAPEVLALSEGNRVAELKTLTEETSKIVKNFSHLVGLGSVGVGLFAMVQSQNLKVAATAAVITLAAFKGPDFFTTTALI
jgi:hypothetical protein